MRRPRERLDAARLDDIRESCAIILDRLRHKQLPDFVSDLALQDGIVHRLALIGEASNNLSDVTKKRYPGIQWKDMITLRNHSMHEYWDLDAMKIWKIAREEVPEIARILG